MSAVLVGVRVTALPKVADQVPEDGDVVVIPAAPGRRVLAKLATAHDAPESLALGIPRVGGAAPKRGAILIGQTS